MVAMYITMEIICVCESIYVELAKKWESGQRNEGRDVQREAGKRQRLRQIYG